MGQYVRGVSINRINANGTRSQIGTGLSGDDEGTQLSLQSAGNWLPGLNVDDRYEIVFAPGNVRVMTFVNGAGGTLTFR